MAKRFTKYSYCIYENKTVCDFVHACGVKKRNHSDSNPDQ